MENPEIVLHVWLQSLIKCNEVEYKTKCGLVLFTGDGICWGNDIIIFQLNSAQCQRL